MRKERMPKGWTQVSTNKSTVGSKQKFAIKNSGRVSYEDLKDEANRAYEAKESRKENLIQAYDSKKLKSNSLIKEAQAIKRAKEKSKS
jgi:hypothetical protein